MGEFLFKPAPHTEAIDFIKSKPVVSREVFAGLLPELRARAFLISGVEAANVVQDIRDRIADLPAGANWDDVKKDLIADLHPWLANDDDPENTRAAERRAELLLRTHGFQAYQASAYQVMDRQREVFPFWQYHSMGDDHVRAMHAALDGVVLPANHEFWKTHFPPWEFGCRCQVIPISEDDKRDLERRDERRAPDNRDVLDDFSQLELTTSRRLVRNGVTFNMTAPSEQGKPGAFAWHPGDLRIPVDELRARYIGSPGGQQTWDEFEAFAKRTGIPETKLTVWEWMSGSPIIPPTASPTLQVLPLAETFQQMLSRLRLEHKTQWTGDDVRAVMNEMREDNPINAASVVQSITASTKTGKFGSETMRKIVQGVLDFIPSKFEAQLKPLQIEVVNSLGKGVLGTYSNGVLRISKSTHKQFPLEKVETTIYHELMHWIHRDMKGPEADAFRARIAAHYHARTKHDVPYPFGKSGQIRNDKWWWKYAGLEYNFESGNPQGLEVPTAYFQLFSEPEKLAWWSDPKNNPNAAGFLETMKLVASIFFEA